VSVCNGLGGCPDLRPQGRFTVAGPWPIFTAFPRVPGPRSCRWRV